MEKDEPLGKGMFQEGPEKSLFIIKIVNLKYRDVCKSIVIVHHDTKREI